MSTESTNDALESPPATNPREVRGRLQELAGQRKRMRDDHAARSAERAAQQSYLAVADQVTAALQQLSHTLFQEMLAVIEEKLTIALQEVLEQPIVLKATADWKRDAVTVEFHIERDGAEEDILRGQGGSVANVLSTGLRLFALTTLPDDHHRRFLVLDEQDCWLQPELVPRLVRIIRQAAAELGFQILMISHHEVSAFERSADRIFELRPNPAGSVDISRIEPQAQIVDQLD